MSIHLQNATVVPPIAKRVPFPVLIELLESQDWQQRRRSRQPDGSSLHLFRHPALGALGYIVVEVIDGTIDAEDFKEIVNYVIT